MKQTVTLYAMLSLFVHVAISDKLVSVVKRENGEGAPSRRALDQPVRLKCHRSIMSRDLGNCTCTQLESTTASSHCMLRLGESCIAPGHYESIHMAGTIDVFQITNADRLVIVPTSDGACHQHFGITEEQHPRVVILNANKKIDGVYRTSAADFTSDKDPLETELVLGVRKEGSSVTTSPFTIVSPGRDGILACSYNGDIRTVFWSKGSDPLNTVHLVTLDMHDSQKQRIGSGYETGRYNITDNYSLVVKNVTESDGGRYYCKVRDLRSESVIFSHTDLKIGTNESIVGTSPFVVGISGSKVILPCWYGRDMYIVFWNKGDDPLNPDHLVSLDMYGAPGKRNGAQYKSGHYNISDDFSLIIKNGTKADEGRYYCEVLDFATGRLIRSHTDVMITSKETSSVTTSPYIRQTLGSDVTLPCWYDRNISSVFWSMGDDPFTSTHLVSLEIYDTSGQPYRKGYEMGRYYIKDDFSLVIRNVTMEDEGRYYCQVRDLDLESVIFSHSDVAIIGHSSNYTTQESTCSPTATSIPSYENNNCGAAIALSVVLGVLSVIGWILFLVLLMRHWKVMVKRSNLGFVTCTGELAPMNGGTRA